MYSKYKMRRPSECFTRCSEEFSSYRELIFHGTNYEYNFSVLFSETRFITAKLMMVGSMLRIIRRLFFVFTN